MTCRGDAVSGLSSRKATQPFENFFKKAVDKIINGVIYYNQIKRRAKAQDQIQKGD